MPNDPSAWLAWLNQYPELRIYGSVALLLLTAWVANWVVKRILLRGLHHILRAMPLGKSGLLSEHNMARRLSNIVPALVLSAGAGLIPGLPAGLVTVVQNVCNAFIILALAQALNCSLDILNLLYQRRKDAVDRPIKSYVQLLQIIIWVLAAILMIASLIDRSPLILLSGLGAMAAVLMLIFQDTLLSLVASVQITSSDIVRVGDWVEIPQLNADGDVIDIALHTVKVQNWDKTITTIPTKRFITDSFKNWRGMQESGGRRIMRSLYLDQNSVHFLDAEEIAHLRRFRLLDSYLKSKEDELHSWNSQLAETNRLPVNSRQLTNIGTFRAYVENYLQHHDDIRQDMTMLVRQLAPGADGLPLELYCFTATTDWARYEAIQSDIFDHMLAILPEFGLRVFQHPSGVDFRALRPFEN